jgi:hypothetical protein
MKLPTGQELLRQGLLALGGAVVAAFFIGKLPGLREWIADQWGNAPHP